MKKNILVNTIPHSGTHLITTILDQLNYRHTKLFIKLYSKKPYYRRQTKAAINWRTSTEIGNYFRFLSSREILVSVSSPRLAKSSVVAGTLSKAKDFEYIIAHMPFSEEGNKLVSQYIHKTITIIRDPRDMALSMLRHIGERKHHIFYAYLFHELTTDSERFKAIVNGFSNQHGNHVGILEMYDSMLHWQSQSHNVTLKFEDLVGEKGGGQNHLQLNALKIMIKHIGIFDTVTDQDIVNISLNSFGKTSTFRKGQIGKWRDSLSLKDKNICKKLFGKLLVKLSYESDNKW